MVLNLTGLFATLGVFSWGDKGYIYLDMSVNNGDICHIQEYITYPVIASVKN